MGDYEGHTEQMGWQCPDATLKLSPVKARAARTPILVDAPSLPSSARTVKTLSTGYVTNP